MNKNTKIISLLLALIMLFSSAEAAFTAGAAATITQSDAVISLRQQLKQRKAKVSVKYNTSASSVSDTQLKKICTTMFSKAYEHTGEADEGDYLKLSVYTTDAKCSYSDGIITVTADVIYKTNSTDEQQLRTTVDGLLSSLKLSGKTDAQKIKAVYACICKTVDYDTANMNNELAISAHTAYSAAIFNKALCDGYSMLLYYMLCSVGIDCRIITGTDGDGFNHAWNIVKISDKYYNVDVTWDGALSDGAAHYDYFLKGSTAFAGHNPESTFLAKAFTSAYPMSETNFNLKCSHNWTKQTVKPTCISEGYVLNRCSLCSDEYKTDYKAKSSHTSDKGTVTKKASCTECGAKEYRCTVCSALIKTEAVMPTWHTDKNSDGKCDSCKITVYKIIASGSCGSKAKWVLNEKGTLSIYGTGNMYDFPFYRDDGTYEYPSYDGAYGGQNFAFYGYKTNFKKCSYIKYLKKVKKVVVYNGINRIGFNAFNGFKSLSSVSLPSTITEIGNWAFADTAITSLTNLPKRMSFLGQETYARCTRLTKVKLPEYIGFVGGSVFADCIKLKTANIGKLNVYIYSGGNFSGCKALESFTVDSSNKMYSLSKGGLYMNNALVAYTHASKATSFTVKKGTVKLSTGALNPANNLKALTIPTSVVEIETHVFDGCDTMSKIDYKGTAAQWCKISFSGELFSLSLGEKAKTRTLCFKSKAVTKLNLETVTNIPAYAFSGITSIKSVTLSPKLEKLGKSAFAYCVNLESVTLPSTLTVLEPCTFTYCKSLKSVKLSSGLKSIGYCAFYNCISLKSITVPKSVKSIGSDAFGIDEYGNKISGFKMKVYKDTAGYKYAKANKLKYSV